MDSRFSLVGLCEEKPVYLVGIGGAGMSAIATVLLDMGFRVEGSDIKESANVKRIRQQGAVVGIGHRADNVGTASVVVKSAAIRDENPELAEAARKGIPIINRAEMLAAIMDRNKGIAIAGTHGKTTTTSLVTRMLQAAGEDPSFLIGGELNETGGNAYFGAGDYLVAEADESDGSLLHLRPQLIILTNIDSDHLDFFKGMEKMEEVFLEFMGGLPEGGFAVVCGDDERARVVGERYLESGGEVYFYGKGEENHYRFSEVETELDGSRFSVMFSGELLARISLGIPGMHNIYNAVSALAAGHRLGLEKGALVEGLEMFAGVRRRFETVGVMNGVRIVDDYAHHPTEIESVLDLAGSAWEGRLVVIFQPHRYSRTRLLAEDLGASFRNAGLLFLTDIYGAGEYPEPGVTGEMVVECARRSFPEKRIIYEPNRAELARAVVLELKEGDLVLTMGAGDITQCGREIMELLENAEK